MPSKEIPIIPSTLETIDEAFFKHLDEELDIRTITNKGRKKVPIIWASAERAFQIKNDKNLRDDSGTLVLPLITIERTLVVKDMNRKGVFWGNVDRDGRGGSIIYKRIFNHDKTSNFANADSYRLEDQQNFPRKNKKIVYQWISMPMPTYIEVTYEVTLRTEYQQQMNELLTPFVTKTGAINYFVMRDNNHFYEGFIQGDMQLTNNVAALGEEERKYETKIHIKVLGYLVGEDKNQETPKMVMHENTVEIKIPQERLISGDIQEHLDNQEDAITRLENAPEL
jgi:hypothetical protein